MFGKGESDKEVDTGRVPFLVHALRSGEAFALAEKVWQENHRYLRFDRQGNKELLRFVFSKPPCVVWLQRDKDRADTYELILVWEGKDADITEVYVISNADATQKAGDDARAQSLLKAILSNPATVPAED